MPSSIIIVDRIEEFRWTRPGDRIVAADEYFLGEGELRDPRIRVVNLCRNHEYLGTAHFCSMIAEARQQEVVPSAAALLRLTQREIWASQMRELNQVLHTRADSFHHGTDTALLFFGEADDSTLRAIGEKVYGAFPFPLLRATIAFAPSPTIVQLVPLTLDELPDRDEKRFLAALDRFAESSVYPPAKPAAGRLRLAILHDPGEPLPPSRIPTLHKFIQVGADMDIDVELIRHRDFGRLAEFDALFIRQTTSIEHYTYRFAEKAERLGMPVIDDTASIRRCTNKVYFAELFQANDIPRPRTWTICRDNLLDIQRVLPFPVVLKKPDGAFSVGVERAITPYEFRTIAARMLESSRLIVAQEFVSSAFDWRIGILGGEALFAARYHMCPRHWQILKHGRAGHAEGQTQAVALDEVPESVMQPAICAAKLIGDGLYGVDLKETPNGALVIEINDNPNIEIGLEDGVLGDRLYRAILDRFRLLVGRSLTGRQRCLATYSPGTARQYRWAPTAAA